MSALAIQTPSFAGRAPVAVEALAPCVRTVGLGKTIDGRAILRDVDLEVRPGEFVAILGSNGAGKSTLLKLLATLAPPSAGSLHLFGARATGDCRELRGRIGLIGHQAMLYRDLTARENLEFFGRLYGVKAPAKRAALLLDVVGLGERADDPVRAFSRGMVQRVAIARAIVHDPELILADEPFDGLDAPSAAGTEQLLGKLCETGKTIVVVNHDIAQSLRIARRAVVLQGGRVAIDAPASSLSVADVLAKVGGL